MSYKTIFFIGFFWSWAVTATVSEPPLAIQNEFARYLVNKESLSFRARCESALLGHWWAPLQKEIRTDEAPAVENIRYESMNPEGTSALATAVLHRSYRFRHRNGPLSYWVKHELERKWALSWADGVITGMLSGAEKKRLYFLGKHAEAPDSFPLAWSGQREFLSFLNLEFGNNFESISRDSINEVLWVRFRKPRKEIEAKLSERLSYRHGTWMVFDSEAWKFFQVHFTVDENMNGLEPVMLPAYAN